MNPVTLDDLSTRSNSVGSGSWRTAQGVVWGSLSVAILSGWFVVTRLGLRQDLRVWDVIALRFGEGAVLWTPALLVGSSRLRFQAWSQGIVLAVLWGAPFILLVGLGLQATSATLTSSVTPALMPVFAGFIAWTFFGERPCRWQLWTNSSRTARSGLRLCLGRRPPRTWRCCSPGDGGGHVGALRVAAAPKRPYFASSSGAHLLLVRHLLPTALYRTRPFESVACVRRGIALSVGISGRPDERGRHLGI
jgi:hypothetical protein